jgi:hypothetical protein
MSRRALTVDDDLYRYLLDHSPRPADGAAPSVLGGRQAMDKRERRRLTTPTANRNRPLSADSCLKREVAGSSWVIRRE